MPTNHIVTDWVGGETLGANKLNSWKNGSVKSGDSTMAGALYYGRVDSNGSALAIPSTFTVSRLAQGNYRLTHNLTKVPDELCIVITPEGRRVLAAPSSTSGLVVSFAYAASPPTSYIEFYFRSPSDATAYDSKFSFLILPL